MEPLCSLNPPKLGDEGSLEGAFSTAYATVYILLQRSPKLKDENKSGGGARLASLGMSGSSPWGLLPRSLRGQMPPEGPRFVEWAVL